MQVFSPAYQVLNAAVSHAPILIVEILWADGTHGTEGVNDIYFGSADISSILNFSYPTRYFPLLDFNSFTGLTQKLDPVSGVSEIGNIAFDLIDVNGMASAIIRDADIAGHGLRRQRVEVYQLFEGMDWADRVKIRTMQVGNLKAKAVGNVLHVTAADIQRTIQKDIFTPKTTQMAVDLALGALTLSLVDASQLETVDNALYGVAGYLKIDNEIIKWTSKNPATNVVTIPAGGRGQFGTSDAAHTVVGSSGATVVQEICVLRGNAIDIALRILTSSGTGANGAYDTLPAHWGCNLDPNGLWPDINLGQWLAAGGAAANLDLTAAVPRDSGWQLDFIYDKSVNAKTFIETQIMRVIGAFTKVNGDGSYGAAPYSDIANATAAQATRTMTTRDVVSWGDLDYAYDRMANEMELQYGEFPPLSNAGYRTAYFVDAASKLKWGPATPLKYVAKGLIPDAANITAFYTRFAAVAARKSRPPLTLPIVATPNHNDIECGDILRIVLPIDDLLTGATLDRVFEVDQVGIASNGEVSCTLLAQPEAADVAALVGAFSGTTVTKVADAAYQIGTDITALWDGSVNYSLASGVYWVGGNLTIAAGVTLTITGSVTLYVRGLFTVLGTINGRGRGGQGIAAYPALGAPYPAGYPAEYLIPGLAPSGSNAVAYIGRGGSSGYAYANNLWYAPGAALPSPAYNSAPTLAITPTTVDAATLQWQGISGIPTITLQGSGGARGSRAETSSVYIGASGSGGAGFACVCRGLDISPGSTALIDLGATNAENNTGVYYGGGSGGGGGGTFAAFVERHPTGIYTDIFDPAKVVVTGGSGGARVSVDAYGHTATDGSAGTAGAIIHQSF